MAEAIRGSFRSVTGQELEKRLWPAEGQPKAVVQFVHGMAEHIDRYDAPAKALNQASFIVVGHTHLGHGQNAAVKGYFCRQGRLGRADRRHQRPAPGGAGPVS